MSGARAWLLDRLPAGLLSRPDEWLVALLCLISGMGAAAGVVDVNSVESLLPQVVYRAWGLVLLVGAAGLFCGLSSIQRVPNGYIVSRAPCYRLGQRLLGTGGAVYAACLFVVVGPPAVVAGGVILCFSIARGIRLLTMGERHGND